jgi:hypothetical protein
MNWYTSQSSNIWSNTTLTDINLRDEMHTILYGSNTYKRLGHWIVYRRFDRTKKSEFYSERTHEGVGGPSHLYTDVLLRTRRVPTDRTGLPLDAVKVGLDLSEKDLYYLEYTVNPKIGDEIFEIEWNDHNVTPSLGNINYKDRYIIKRTHDYRLEGGNVQYYIVSTQYNEVTY